MEIVMQEDWERNTVRMYAVIDKGGPLTVIGQENGKLIEQEIKPMVAPISSLRPLIEMNSLFAKEFIEAVCAYGKRTGVKDADESMIKGKLQATETHLNDMRAHFTKLLDAFIPTKSKK